MKSGNQPDEAWGLICWGPIEFHDPEGFGELNLPKETTVWESEGGWDSVLFHPYSDGEQHRKPLLRAYIHDACLISRLRVPNAIVNEVVYTPVKPTAEHVRFTPHIDQFRTEEEAEDELDEGQFAFLQKVGYLRQRTRTNTALTEPVEQLQEKQDD